MRGGEGFRIGRLRRLVQLNNGGGGGSSSGRGVDLPVLASESSIFKVLESLAPITARICPQPKG